jgi:CII-binding regulator of phage lambda lysogenization HflD
MTRDEREQVRELINGIMCIKKLIDRHVNKIMPELETYALDLLALESDAEMGIDVCLSLEEVAKKIVKSTEKIKAEVSKTDKYFELIHRMDKYLTAKEK